MSVEKRLRHLQLLVTAMLSRINAIRDELIVLRSRDVERVPPLEREARTKIAVRKAAIFLQLKRALEALERELDEFARQMTEENCVYA